MDEAIACYRKAIELDPKFAYPYNNLGFALRDPKKLGEAIEAFHKAIELNPKFAHPYIGLGNALRDQKKLPEAVDAYHKAIELDPKYAPAYNGLGNALLDQKKLPEAIDAYSKAIELDPKNAGACNNLAWLLATCSDAKFRDPERALALAKKAVDFARNNGTYLNTLGAALYRAGDWKAGIAALEKSMAFNKGGNSLEWFFLAMAHWQLGEKDHAREWYDRAVQWMDKNAPNDADLRRFRAEACELLEVKEQK